MRWCAGVCVVLAICLHSTNSQIPQRLNIPGAILVQGQKPLPQRQQRLNALSLDFVPRPAPRPRLVGAPIREIRPVIEEEEDFPPAPSPSISSFDAEVNKLSISAVNSALKQAEQDEEYQQPIARPAPPPFRPERPVPVTRDQIRDSPQRPLPVVRQESRPPPRPIRPVVRQEIDEEEEENIPRQPIRQKARPQAFTQTQYRPAARPKTSPEEDELNRKRKPVVQILRKYRTDNEDGSITWGFENEDGTFKEETLGTDCVIRGKYGYVDPDGVKREFEYETGNKCDPNAQEELDEDELDLPPPRVPLKKPVNVGKQQQQQQQPQIQYRPQLAPQY